MTIKAAFSSKYKFEGFSLNMKKIVTLGLLFLLSLSAILGAAPASAQSSNPLAVNTSAFAFYNSGLQSMFSTLLKPAPCGSGLSALSEAPSVPYNWWTDDNAKALGALSYVYPDYATQASGLLSFVQHNTINGYLIKRCQQITPSIVNQSLTNMTARNNLYVVQGNPTLGLLNSSQLFRVYLNENPQIANAYIESQVASINNVTIALDTGISQILINGGFDGTGGNALVPWTGTGTANSTFFRSPPNSLYLGASEGVSQTFPTNLQENTTSSVTNMTWWATSGSQYNEQYKAVVLYTDGTNSTFVETATPSTAPGTFTEGTIAKSQFTPKKLVSGIEFSTAGLNGTDVMIDDVSFYSGLFTPVFSVSQLGQNVVMQESAIFQSVNITLRYTLVPNLPYINVTSTLTNTGSTTIKDPTIYNAFDGLDSIGSGYSSLYFPGNGWERANQSANAITGGYLPSNWNQNWFAVGIKGMPDWIGNDAIFVILNQANMPGGSAAFKLNQIFNTEFQNSTFVSPGDYLHWLQMSFNDAGSVAPGQSVSYGMKYVFVTSYDWTNMGIYSTFLNGSNINNWNNTNIGNNYYYGEVANDLALYSLATGAQSSPAFPTTLQVWNYYYRMIQAENNGTYTASLARFVNASSILYKMTGNSSYLSAVTYAANLLATMQQQSSSMSVNNALYFHFDPGISTINTIPTFGAVFDSTAQMGTGKVYSGQTISLNFFMSPVLQSSLNLTGTLKTIFYMNANAGGVDAYYNTSIDYITSSGSSFATLGSTTRSIMLPEGSGHPSFSPFESDILLSKYNVPAGATIALHLYLSVPVGDTVYALVDSTNGPSSITLPASQNAQWQGAFTILPPKESAAIAAPQQQPYALDLTAISGKAMYTAYQLTGNVAYYDSAASALAAIHWGSSPQNFKLLSVPSNAPAAMRLYSYVNSTYIDTDYSTYKAMLVADFAEGLNNTLANIAISRVWDRSIVNSTFVQINTGESTGPHIEMNSETQPWGLEAWLQYDLYWQQALPNSNFALYINFANEQDTLQSVTYQAPSGKTASSLTLVVNGTGLDTFYVDTANSVPSTVTMNGSPVQFTYDKTVGPVPGETYVTWTSQLGSPDVFVITYSSGGGSSGGGCAASSSPTISSPAVYAQIGTTAIATVSISNQADNQSATIGTIAYVAPNGIQVTSYKGIPQTLNILSSGYSFQIQVSVSNSTLPGTYKVNATAPFSSPSCSSVFGMVSFTITVTAGTGPAPSQNLTIQWLEQWWWLIVVLVVVAAGAFYVVHKTMEEQ